MEFEFEKIESAWNDYRTQKVLRVLKSGKWEIKELGAHPLNSIDGVRAEICNVHQIMSFPQFLKTYYG